MYNTNIFPIIDTEIILFRKLNIEDAEDLFEIFSSENVVKYYGIDKHKEIGETINLINSLNLNFDNVTAIRWAIELKNEKKVIGTCGFYSWNKVHKRAAIGYELNENYCYFVGKFQNLYMYSILKRTLNK